MTVQPWEFDDGSIADSELLYRRIPKRPDHRTFDPERECWVPSTAALRRDANQGMSVHLDTVVRTRRRDPQTLYDSTKYGSIAFPAGLPRCEGAGVLPTTPTAEEEPDPDLRAAHAEVRPSQPQKDRAAWSRVTNVILLRATWVQPAD